MRNVSPAEAKEFMDSASPEDLAAAAAALDEEAKERLLAALRDPELQQALLFYQEGSSCDSSPRDL
jgi:hypothetical protein